MQLVHLHVGPRTPFGAERICIEGQLVWPDIRFGQAGGQAGSPGQWSPESWLTNNIAGEPARPGADTCLKNAAREPGDVVTRGPPVRVQGQLGAQHCRLQQLQPGSGKANVLRPPPHPPYREKKERKSSPQSSFLWELEKQVSHPLDRLS